MKFIGKALFAVMVSAAVAATPVAAKEARIVIGTAGDGTLQQGMDFFAEKLAEKTGGEITGKVYKGSLLNYAETPKGLAEGVADVGYVVPAYVRGEFPISSFATDITSTIVEPVAVGGAMSELIYTCEPCLEEFKRQNQIFMGFAVIGPYRLMSTEKIETVADAEGMKVRGFGAFNDLVSSLGGISVTLTANEVYEAFSNGQLDANIHLWDLIKILSLGDYVDYMYEYPVGIYGGNSMYNTNLEFWRSLTDEQKAQFVETAAESVAHVTVNYFAGEEALAAKGEELGVQSVPMAPDVQAEVEKFQKANIEKVIAGAVEKGDIENAQEIADQLMSLLEKWRGLAEGIDTSDEAAVAELYKTELFGKVDLTTLE